MFSITVAERLHEMFMVCHSHQLWLTMMLFLLHFAFSFFVVVDYDPPFLSCCDCW